MILLKINSLHYCDLFTPVLDRENWEGGGGIKGLEAREEERGWNGEGMLESNEERDIEFDWIDKFSDILDPILLIIWLSKRLSDWVINFLWN